MSHDQRTRLEALATAFRAMLDSMPQRARSVLPTLERFPRGSCGDASLLLSEFLSEHGIATEYVAGSRDGYSHAWLEVDGLSVDITADQFGLAPVLIEDVRARTLIGFEEIDRHVGSFRIYDAATVFRLRSAYVAICEAQHGPPLAR